MTKKRLTLSQQQRYVPGSATQVGQHVTSYQVTKVVNATHPRIGEILSDADAAEYCEHADWNVTIIRGTET